jgi:beta-phosphoglucomutase-like phosphatase (HAD superfamily)
VTHRCSRRTGEHERIILLTHELAEVLRHFGVEQCGERHDGIRLVVARTSHDPALLKPNPHLINKAVRGLDAAPAASALVGDSFTDIEAAQRAGVASIGYADKPGKHERMTQLRAGAVITSMADLALSLRAHPTNPELTLLLLSSAVQSWGV